MEPANYQLQRLKIFISPLYLANTAEEKAYLLKAFHLRKLNSGSQPSIRVAGSSKIERWPRKVAFLSSKGRKDAQTGIQTDAAHRIQITTPLH